MIETYTPSLMQLTEGAVQKILSLRDNESQSNILNLRVYVTGGGCSGFQYTWGLSETKTDDEIIDNILLLDPLAVMYVIGSKIDYVTELGGSFLTVVNPKATAQCGCGESFSV